MIRYLLFVVAVLALPVGQLLSEEQNVTTSRTMRVAPRGVAATTAIRLFPPRAELKEENAAVVLLRLPYERNQYLRDVASKFEEYLQLPFDDPTLPEKIQFAGLYQELRRAAYCTHADWEYPLDEVPAAGILLPDLNAARNLPGRALVLWTRTKIAARDMPGACEAILVGLATARHYAATPIAVNQIVSTGMANNTLDELERLIGQPESPNLYWAITLIPRPFFELRPVYNWESHVLRRSSSTFLQAYPDSENEQAWTAYANELLQLLALLGDEATDDERKAQWADFVRYARDKWTPEFELTDEALDAMSDNEVGVRAYFWYNEHFASRIESAAALPLPQAITMLDKIEKELRGMTVTWPDLASFGVHERPLLVHVRLHHVDRRLAALANIEAIRDHVSRNDGKLPEQLSDVVHLPIVADPLTGQPFHYEVAGDKFRLRGNSDEFISDPKLRIDYDVTVTSLTGKP